MTMVNIIGVPVMLIGTLKHERFFEADLRSARRGQGLELYSGILYNKRNVESPIKSGSLLRIIFGNYSFYNAKMRCYRMRSVMCGMS